MEKYCDKCNVNIEELKQYCPLCGRFCGEEEKPAPDKNNCYPDYVEYLNKKSLIIKIILVSILAANIVLILTELIYSKQFDWSLQVLIASVFFVLAILFPVSKNFNIFKQNIIFVVMLSAYIVTLELTTRSFGWGVVYAVPLYYLLVQLTYLFFMFYKRYEEIELFAPIIFIFILSLTVFLVNWLLDLVLWPSFIALLGGINLLILLLIFKFRKSKNEIKKNLHI